MCGIAGIFARSGNSHATELNRLAGEMGSRLAHRGPDAAGTWSAHGEPVALAHRRLSILDLTEEGGQPMTSRCGRFVIVYNGEIYNFPTLRSDVERKEGFVGWRGRSDTEVILEVMARFGAEEGARRAHGMYAFALWDRRDRVLHLVRDRLGKKPLYYGFAGEDLLFGSEIRALAAHGRCDLEPDGRAMLGFLRRGYIVAPYSGYLGISKLEPGSILSISESDVDRRLLPAPRKYWRSEALRTLAEHAPSDPGRLENELSDAVAARIVADVPVGAFLSGGIDSSLVVAKMTQLAGRGVRTFTIGFGDRESNEADDAAAVARHLGTDHCELILSPQEAVNLVPKVVDVFEEPFGDVSAVPTWLVSQLAASSVKVVLSGDGADELFGGYTRYSDNAVIWRWRSLMPSCLTMAGKRMLGESLGMFHSGRVASLIAAATATDASEFYMTRTSHLHDPGLFLPGTLEYGSRNPLSGPLRGNIEREMMYQDVVTYLPDDILAKVDRASMAHGLEVRSPFLDERLVQFAWGLSDDKVTGRYQGKRLLRELLFKLVPRSLVDRPKQGFAPQLDQWLRGPLREWAGYQLIESSKLEAAGFNGAAIRTLWDGFVAGNKRLAGGAWNLVVLSVWLERQHSLPAR